MLLVGRLLTDHVHVLLKHESRCRLHVAVGLHPYHKIPGVIRIMREAVPVGPGYQPFTNVSLIL